MVQDEDQIIIMKRKKSCPGADVSSRLWQKLQLILNDKEFVDFFFAYHCSNSNRIDDRLPLLIHHVRKSSTRNKIVRRSKELFLIQRDAQGSWSPYVTFVSFGEECGESFIRNPIILFFYCRY
ncbi:hypothetical protein NPIL_65941 [Nephila pilipes]|uniref:Uncharacterized protein n=1 Tax=Nephila pilipes TaxID=299642 RepID=A0A8X6QN00_NEPPI|nr:hypothetical protein NPIL_65941 [Nephila pilipes]